MSTAYTSNQLQLCNDTDCKISYKRRGWPGRDETWELCAERAQCGLAARLGRGSPRFDVIVGAHAEYIYGTGEASELLSSPLSTTHIMVKVGINGYAAQNSSYLCAC